MQTPDFTSKSKLWHFLLSLLLALWAYSPGFSQDVTTIQASSEDISDNLDLEAVASIFGDSKDVEDFEKRLNDPDTKISNLDLNQDGEVDYLRVMETVEGQLHIISIEAVIGKDLYQEVATIEVMKDNKGETQVQVIGNVDMYGPNYYITPVYPVVPVFFTFFWIAAYRPWYSPWYWGYHPPYFRPWHPYPSYYYRSNVHVHVNIHNTYNRTNVRINSNYRQTTRNNAYFNNNPDRSFSKRNPGMSNRAQLESQRKARPASRDYKSTGRPVQRPAAGPGDNRAAKQATRPAQQPQARPSQTRPTQRPATRPSARPSYSKPSSRQSTRPTPSRRPAPRSSHLRTRH